MTKLIAKAQKGNKKAMETIYKSTSDELAFFCLRLCGNEHDGQDLMQDTYLTAFEKLEQYRRDDNFKGWLHTIALHKFYNKIRDEKPQLWIDDELKNIPDDELNGPENYAERKELNKLLTEIMSDKLSDAQRITVMLYYYDDMNVSEIANELNCPEGTVKTRLYHSRKILRDELLKHSITLSGSVIIVSAVLKSQAAAFTASAASTAAVMSSVIGKSAASTAAKSVAAYTKGKLIAGAAAVAVIGGAAGLNYIVSENKEEISSSKTELSQNIESPTFKNASLPTAIPAPTERIEHTTELITEPPTGISEPGGALEEYVFDVNNMKMSIPERYTPSEFFKSSTQNGGFELVETRIHPSNIDNKTFLSLHVKSILKFKSDNFSGDEVLMMERLEEPENISVNDILSELYDNVSLADSQQFIIPVDNSNAPDKPTEKSAERFSFTADGDYAPINGTALMFRGNVKSTHIIVFCDCSGIRQQEYEDIINSISLSYSDNSWREEFDIPEGF